jgi:hypothetical protein
VAGPAGFEPATLGSEGLHGLLDLDALSVLGDGPGRRLGSVAINELRF